MQLAACETLIEIGETAEPDGECREQEEECDNG